MSRGCVILHDFTSGKTRSRNGDASPRRYGTVVAVARGRIDDLLSTRTPGERTRILRELRDEGMLVCRPGRLTHKVSGGPPPLPRQPVRAYVFAVADPAYVEVAVARIRRRR